MSLCIINLATDENLKNSHIKKKIYVFFSITFFVIIYSANNKGDFFLSLVWGSIEDNSGHLSSFTGKGYKM